MEHRSWARHGRRSVGTAVLTAVLAGIATPAFAGHPTKTPPPSSPSSPSTSTATSPFTQGAIARAAAAAPDADVATSAPAPARTPAKAPQTSNGFLKSRTGVIVLAIFAAGTGYAIYSAKEDRIHGRNR